MPEGQTEEFSSFRQRVIIGGRLCRAAALTLNCLPSAKLGFQRNELAGAIMRSCITRIINLYWWVRHNTRNRSARRKYYRYIFQEKKRLIESGAVDPECLRLFCRSLSKIHCGHARRNYESYKNNCSICR